MSIAERTIERVYTQLNKIVVRVPEKDYDLAQKLINGLSDAGIQVEELTFERSAGNNNWYNPNILKPELAVRLLLRDAVMNKLGLNSKNSASLKSTPSAIKEVTDILDGPVFMGMGWTGVSNENLGDFGEILGQSKNGVVTLPDKGVLLFPEEVESLKLGRLAVTNHYLKFNYGFPSEMIEAYFAKGTLHRVRAIQTL